MSATNSKPKADNDGKKGRKDVDRPRSLPITRQCVYAEILKKIKAYPDLKYLYTNVSRIRGSRGGGEGEQN